MNSIIIASLKSDKELADVIQEFTSKAVLPYELIISSSPNSVSYNSNRALERATGEYILKIDDDVFDAPYAWDKKLIDVLEENANVVIVSARVMNPNGTIQNTCSQSFDLIPSLVEPPSGLAPFCCVAWRNDGMRFDENFKGSSFDDTDFNFQMRMKYPYGIAMINNDVRIKHKLESKNCLFGLNEIYFKSKWSGVVFPDGRVRV
jgi:hypothetical protein